MDKYNIHCNVWDEIAYPFPNVKVWKWISNFIPHFNPVKLNRVSNRGPRNQTDILHLEELYYIIYTMLWWYLKMVAKTTFEMLIPTFNSLAPGRFECTLRWLIVNLILIIDGWGISCEVALRWWVNIGSVMAWCHQAISHSQSQC